MRGRSHERCQLLGYGNRQYAFRQEEDDANSSTSSSTESVLSAHALRSYASPPSTPPSKPPSSTSGSFFSDAFSALTTSAEKEVRRALAPPPPVYPPTVLSDASWEVPETGSFYHANKRYVHPVPVPRAPPSIVGSIAPTEPTGTTGDALTEVSVNLRGASPGPSAHAFMAQSDDGSVGPCLSERIAMNRKRNTSPLANSVMTARPGQQFSSKTLQPDEQAQNESSTSTTTKPFWASDASVVANKYPYWPANMATPAPTPSRRISEPISIMAPPSDPGLDAAVAFAEEFFQIPLGLQIGRFALQFGVCFVASVVGGYVSKQFL